MTASEAGRPVNASSTRWGSTSNASSICAFERDGDRRGISVERLDPGNGVIAGEHSVPSRPTSTPSTSRSPVAVTPVATTTARGGHRALHRGLQVGGIREDVGNSM